MSEILQLPLNVTLNDESRFDNFYPHDNEQIILALQAFLKTSNETVFYLWGDRGVGKSHLLQAAAALAKDEHVSALYIDGALSLIHI